MTKFRFRKIYVFFSAVLAFMIHLPFAFSNSKPVSTKNNTTVTPVATEEHAVSTVYKIYDSLKLNLQGLSQDAFNYAVQGYEYLKAKGKINNENVLTIADFTKASSKKRLFVIDVKNFKVLFNTYVAHGQGSGEAMATSFSNIPESYQSSPGFYTTSGTYMGKNGYSMRLEGMEQGINDRAEERAIVMHGAPYVSESFIHMKGYLGRSWGCPAVPEELNKPIIEKIKNGSCLFIYNGNSRYIHSSRILNVA